MEVPHLEDRWLIGDEMILSDGISMYGDGYIWNWDGINGFWVEIGWIFEISKIWISRNLCLSGRPAILQT